MSKLAIAGIITDAHIPYEHKRRYAAMMNCLTDVGNGGLARLYIIGDYVDFYGINGHGPKDPTIFESFQDEVDRANASLDEIDKTWPNIRKTYIEGNHEFRFERYLNEKCPELFGLTSTAKLLKMDSRPGWHWASYGPRQLEQVLSSKLFIKHEPTTTSLIQMAKEHGASLTFGHLHRIMESVHRTIDDRKLVSFCGGWMGDDSKKVFSYVKGHLKWQNGFVIVVVNVKTQEFWHHVVEFNSEDACLYNGKLYRP